MKKLFSLMLWASSLYGWSACINFRATSGYVTDPAGCTYALSRGSGHDSAYPISRGGFTFGWLDTNQFDANRSTSPTNKNLAGINYNNTGSNSDFRIDLPSAGNYTITIALGDYSFGQTNTGAKLYDNTTLLATIGPTNTSAGHFLDATGADITDATYPGASITKTFATTTFIIRLPSADFGSGTQAIATVTIASADTITLGANSISDRIMLFNSAPPYPAKVSITGTGTALNYSCSGTGCTYAKIEFCVVDSSPCTTTTSAPAYIGVAIGEPFHVTNTYNVAAGTYPISITVSSSGSCTGSCVITTNLVIETPTYPTFTSPSGATYNCVSGGSEPTYHFSQNGITDLCTISNVRPGGTYDMPTIGNFAADPQFGVGRTWSSSGTYKKIADPQRAIGGDAVTSQFNADGSFVLTNNISPDTGTLIAVKTDGTGDYWSSIPQGLNSWDPTNPLIMYYAKSSTPDVQKVTFPSSCGSPPCSSGWTDTTLYSYPGGSSVATQLSNGGDGGVSREGLWPLFTYQTTDPAIVLLNTTTGTAVTKSLTYEDIPLLCPQNGTPAGNGYYQVISSISNTTPPEITTAATHGFVTGQTVFIRNSDISAYNGTWKITVTGASTFTIPTTAGGAGTGGEAIRWAPRLLTGAKATSSNGRYYMILAAYPGGSNYILSWATGESTITIDGPQAAMPWQILGSDGVGTNTFYDGPVPNHAICNAGYCEPAWHQDFIQGGDGNAWLIWPCGTRYPTVVHQCASKPDTPSLMETPLEAGGNMLDLQVVGQHDQHQGGALNAPIMVMDNDGDATATVAYQISNATNASPIVITTTSAYGGANGDVVLINNVGGNTAANGLCTVANLVGTSFECAGSTGNGAYTANTGSLVKNETPAQTSFQAETWIWNFANIASKQTTVTRLLVHRSWSWGDRIGAGYYGQPHSVVSPDGKWIAFESNGGVPDDYGVYYAPTGYTGSSGFILGNEWCQIPVTGLTTLCIFNSSHIR